MANRAGLAGIAGMLGCRRCPAVERTGWRLKHAAVAEEVGVDSSIADFS